MQCAYFATSFHGSKAKQSDLYLLTQAGYVAAIQLMWVCGMTACALRISSEYGWTAGCWMLGCGSDDGDSNPRE